MFHKEKDKFYLKKDIKAQKGVRVLLYYFLNLSARWEPTPVAERSKARVYSRSLARIADSNPAEDMDVCRF